MGFEDNSMNDVLEKPYADTEQTLKNLEATQPNDFETVIKNFKQENKLENFTLNSLNLPQLSKLKTMAQTAITKDTNSQVVRVIPHDYNSDIGWRSGK